jgi:hypothetical protein
MPPVKTLPLPPSALEPVGVWHISVLFEKPGGRGKDSVESGSKWKRMKKFLLLENGFCGGSL